MKKGRGTEERRVYTGLLGEISPLSRLVTDLLSLLLFSHSDLCTSTLLIIQTPFHQSPPEYKGWGQGQLKGRVQLTIGQIHIETVFRMR